MFDLIGDVHGCIDELWDLLEKLGYRKGLTIYPRTDRKVIFCGDLNDRGPDSLAVLTVAMGMVCDGSALAVIGNHDDKLRRALSGNQVKATHGLAETLAQLETVDQGKRNEIRDFLNTLPIELILDDGKLSVSHAGLPESLQGKTNGHAKSHALFGATTGKTDDRGYPERLDWAKDYKGSRVVVHGHTPMKEVRNLNNVWCIDTGVPFGNKLTALQYPEMTLVQVPSIKNYQPFHPF